MVVFVTRHTSSTVQIYDVDGAGWNQPRLSASSSRVILRSVPESACSASCRNGARRAYSRVQSRQTIGCIRIIQLMHIPSLCLGTVPFHKSSRIGVLVPALRIDTGCCATVDIEAFSLLVNTSSSLVTLPWTNPMVQLEALQASSVALCLKLASVHMALFSAKSTPLSMSPLLQAESIVSHSTSCCCDIVWVHPLSTARAPSSAPVSNLRTDSFQGSIRGSYHSRS